MTASGGNMFWLILACQDTSESKKQTMQPSKEKVQITTSEQTVLEKPQAGAPTALPKKTGIDTSDKVVIHPPPLKNQNRPVIDVCLPYGKLLKQEKLRGSPAASEKERIAALRDLNRTLEYHPSDTAQAIVELEKEVLVGPIHLSLEERTQYWYRIHSYIGSICRADISKIARPQK